MVGQAAPAREPPGRLAEIMAQVKAQRYPPVHKWHPERCGGIDMRIARDGTWYYMGSPIGRPEMVKLFSSVLRRDGDAFFLVTPVEKLEIEVEDAPYMAVEMQRHGTGEDQVLSFRTQTDEWVIADARHPIRVETDSVSGEPSPYVRVRDRLDALLARPVFYELVALAEETGEGLLAVRSRGALFPLGSIEGAAG